MKKLLLPLLALGLVVSCGSESTKAPKLNTYLDTMAWAYGQNFADVLKQGVLDSLNEDLVLQAVRHSLAGGRQPISSEETSLALHRLSAMQNMAMRQEAQQISHSVKQQQEAFLDNLEKTNPNVKKHPSGFYYEVLKQGKGPNAKMAQRILFDYRSKLMLSGEPFDQTYGKREPIMHVVGNPMFPGLIDAFQLMNPGSIYRFYFPYELAFGERGSGTVPGYTPLIYEVELHQTYEN